MSDHRQNSSPPEDLTNTVLLAKIDDRLETLQSETLPEMKQDIREARDGSIANGIEIKNINSQVEEIRETTHTCTQAQTIGSMERAIKIVITVAVLLAVPSGAYILNDVRADASTSHAIQSNTKSIKQVNDNQSKQVKNHDDQLKEINARIESLPSTLRSQLEEDHWETWSDDEFEEYIKVLPERDKRRMRVMWRRARLMRQKNLD